MPNNPLEDPTAGVCDVLPPNAEAAGPSYSDDGQDGLIDAWGRCITDLRVSLTDRCNLRCSYCVPAGKLDFIARERLLSRAELVRLVEIAASLGIKKFRLTGGEPLMRRDLASLVADMHRLPAVEEVPITTNGVLLAEQAQALYTAGARRLNISLDALSRHGFELLTRRNVLNRVLAGITLAQKTCLSAVTAGPWIA